MRTSKEVVLFIGAQEEDLRVFFGPFLIVHLAPNSDMADYLGFTSPKDLAPLMDALKPQMGIHILSSV
ncbi:MAG: hypothetical protein WAL98_05550 [Desulfatiglandaceae bacterium]